MGLKYFRLMTGYEDGWEWQIECIIKSNGTFMSKGHLNYRNRKKYRNDNRIKIRKYRRQWYESHKKEEKNRMNFYCVKHKEKRKESNRNYRKKNKNKIVESNKKWREEHRNQYLEAKRKNQHKRNRNFGFIPLNEWFKDSHVHHIDKNCVIYIPVELHKSIWHSLVNNINMDKINALAFKYLFEHS